ncbi:hypothetical protein [Brevundimonas sp. UBA2416]|jgi:hypothetical protein|uniref:hypothetical protein n=1 Tax=Brevundimonas sp. UBA2416 TaxID=1946124 RepID=UPI0025BD5D16|nr:hypothetical protein [Brevundimonas sp. UBA2416]
MTGHVTLSEALEVVQRAAEADPALRSMIFARLGATDPTRPANDAPVRLPPIEAMNAVQAAVFDNWPSDRRVTGRPNRYGMAIEIWTAPPERINVARRGNYQHKVNVALMDAKAIKAWVKTVEKTNAKRLNPLSVDFLAGLAEAATIMGPGEFLGVCAVKTPGAGHVYFDHQWVHVRLDGEATRATISIDGVGLVLPTFSSTAPNGDQLGAGVILQSRLDRAGFSTSWATPEHEHASLALVA